MILGTTFSKLVHRLAGIALSCLLVLTSVVVPTVPVQAASGDRTLYLYYTHTKETARITFRRNGRYDQAGLRKLNTFLRDWRRNEPTKMDPALFDLIWEVYQKVGASKPVHVVSAYRAPATNEMLRSRSSAVAKNSRHTQGMAMDFYIPGVPISKLREAAMRKQVGGVGYYPTSGSPFVHLDTGNVRAWPRMTRAQLTRLFPKGKTLHVPTDGNPISQSGYQYAKSQWVKCHSVPCSARTTSGTTRVARADTSAPTQRSGDTKDLGETLFGWLFGNEGDEAGEATAVRTTTVASVKAPASAPTPATRSAGLRKPSDLVEFALATDLSVAPAPLARPSWMTRQPDIAVASLDATDLAAPAPAPSIGNRGTRVPDGQASQLLTAYAPQITQEPDAQRALQMLIERRVAEQLQTQPTKPNLNTTDLRLATASTGPDLKQLGALLSGTMRAVSGNKTNTLLNQALNNPTRTVQPRKPLPAPNMAIAARDVELIAPDLEHVTDIFIDPSAISSARYAVIFDRDQGHFSPDTELGAYATRMVFSQPPAGEPSNTTFNRNQTLLLAAR